MPIRMEVDAECERLLPGTPSALEALLSAHCLASPPPLHMDALVGVLTDVEQLVQAGRFLAAGHLLKAIDVTAATEPAAAAFVRRTAELHSTLVYRWRDRYAELQTAIRTLAGGRPPRMVGGGPSVGAASDWSVAYERRGIVTRTARDDSGALWLRTAGTIEGASCTEVASLWREVDLFERWFPLCSASRSLGRPEPFDELAALELQLSVRLPIGVAVGLTRCLHVRSFGCDALEDGAVLFSAASLKPDEESAAGASGDASARLIALYACVQPLDHVTSHCTFALATELNLPVPTALLAAAMARVVTAAMGSLRREARRLGRGDADAAHARRIASDQPLYEGIIGARARRWLRGGGHDPPPPATPATQRRARDEESCPCLSAAHTARAELDSVADRPACRHASPTVPEAARAAVHRGEGAACSKGFANGHTNRADTASCGTERAWTRLGGSPLSQSGRGRTMWRRLVLECCGGCRRRLRRCLRDQALQNWKETGQGRDEVEQGLHVV